MISYCDYCSWLGDGMWGPRLYEVESVHSEKWHDWVNRKVASDRHIQHHPPPCGVKNKALYVYTLENG